MVDDEGGRMSRCDYQLAVKILVYEPSFNSIIMAAMWKADATNLKKLTSAWPEIWDEFSARHQAPWGLLPGEVRMEE